MTVRIPFVNPKKGVTLKRCVERCATESGHSQHAVAIMMTHFLEAIADEVAKGRAVAIPGFGMFVQQARVYNGRTHFRPGFVPSKAFRHQTLLGTRPDAGVRQSRKNYRESNNGSLEKSDHGERTFRIMQAMRDRIAKQLAP